MTGQTVSDRVRHVVEPDLTAQGLEVVDVEHTGATLRVTVDRPGGIDLDTVSDASRRVSDILDRHDVVPGRYTLEVSSPGIERPLRTPAHFRRAVGSRVAVKTVPDHDGERRLTGTLEAADDEGLVLRVDLESGGDEDDDGARRLSYDEIDRARTVFEWGPAPKPGHGSRSRPGQPRRKKASTP